MKGGIIFNDFRKKVLAPHSGAMSLFYPDIEAVYYSQMLINF
jgi:hypothetical protein